MVKRKNFLLLLLFLTGLGFAYLCSTLSINRNVNVDNNTWGVRFQNINNIDVVTAL